MIRSQIYLILLGLALSAASPVRADHPGAMFLSIAPDARSTALGMAGTGSDAPGSGGYYNAAALGFAPRFDAGWTHVAWLPGLYPGMSYDFASASGQARPGLNVGGSVTYFQTGLASVFDQHGNNLGSYRPFDLAGTVSAGWRALPWLAVGANLKLSYFYLVPGWVFDSMPEMGIEGGVWGLVPAGDLGIQFRPARWFGLGLALNNLGPRISYVHGEPGDPLPLTLRTGLELKTPWDGPVEVCLRADIMPDPAVLTDSLTRVFYRRDPDQYLWKSIGIEARVMKLVSLRLGYFEDPDGYRGGVVVEGDMGFSDHVSLYRYLKHPDYYGKVDHVGLCLGAGLEYRGIAFDVATDDLIYDFPTTNLRCQFSYRLP